MIPIRDDNPTVHRSIATFLIIALNIFTWVFIQGLGFNPTLVESVCRFGLIPAEFAGAVDPGTKVQLGRHATCILDGDPNWYSLFTSMFMHGGWLHLIGNMWFLFVFGDNVEDVMGPFRFIVFYLLCGLAAEGAQYMSNTSSTLPMVGASGAIGGVMGAYAVLFPRAPVHVLVIAGFFLTRVVVPAFFMLGFWVFFQLIAGMLQGGGEGGVAFWAHIGGFFSGIVLLRFFCNGDRVEECRFQRGRTRRWIQQHR
jgi:membrane associated rhomboid family serine protease